MTDASQADLDAIRDTSTRWMRAWIDQDLGALDDVLAADFTLIIGNAPAMRVTRAEWLAMVPRYVCTRFGYHDVQFRDLGGGLVIMSGIADFDASVDGVDRSGRFFVTDAWRRGDDGRDRGGGGDGGGWQVAARYSTRAEPAPDPGLERMGAERRRAG